MSNAFGDLQPIPATHRLRLAVAVLGIFGLAVVFVGIGALMLLQHEGEAPLSVGDLVAALVTPTAALAGAVVAFYFSTPDA